MAAIPVPKSSLKSDHHTKSPIPPSPLCSISTINVHFESTARRTFPLGSQNQCFRYWGLLCSSTSTVSMTAIVQISINSLAFRLSSMQYDTYNKPIKYCSLPRTKIASLKLNRFKLRAFWEGGSISGDGILVKDEGWNRKKKREVVVRFNQGFGFNGGGGGKDDGTTARVLGNIAVAIGLTYLSFTGQLGWLLDAIVSIWLIGFLVPIVGLGAFLWWAGRDMVQDSCPNCGNDFQIFKSTLNDYMQQCPYCSRPFSVVDNKFVMDPVNFSNRSTTFGQAFNYYTFKNREEGFFYGSC